MRFSVSLPRTGMDIPSQARFSATAEECGFHAVSATDHPFPLVGGDSISHQAYDPFTLLAYLAARTQRIRLHFSLLVAGYRNPFLTAQMIATLDEISGGRVIVAFGAGYNRAEFEALGARFTGRGRHTDEVVAAMRSAWEGGPLHAEHHDWTATGNTMFPSYRDRPHPPLWRGGNSDAARASSVRSFDGWAPLEVSETWATKAGTIALTMRTLPDAIADYDRQWRAAGRTGTPDVCLVRGRTDWLRDSGRLVAETQQLEEAGVTWVEITPHGADLDGIEANLRNVAGHLRDAKLLAEN
ncbi:TIGR03619 family F420-dependent LLM class oxidoreductase [Parafrankia sp. EUN1f]|uniref:TIGR03619 family F420-dependent LLM class oxidoreductase n=1 Tax=Parafrankia sp. EUN1f TaxID=102897 RepID=UPI0001C46902|nr:TIGR03619 family F420-dependent LLM class oxidoreductase [Parafrankia sp. EUN1f]EFC80298.1 Coenzyme F420-dependent N5 N10-methylene tetrahydromethanopterin reductase-like protein [Parafrankia sp. EUN1f]